MSSPFLNRNRNSLKMKPRAAPLLPAPAFAWCSDPPAGGCVMVVVASRSVVEVEDGGSVACDGRWMKVEPAAWCTEFWILPNSLWNADFWSFYRTLRMRGMPGMLAEEMNSRNGRLIFCNSQNWSLKFKFSIWSLGPSRSPRLSPILLAAWSD